jgi:polysaccharide export outer membrane protein
MFFAVQKFRMQDKDIIYISNADSVQLSKFLDVVNGVSDTSANVVVNAASTKAAAESLVN